MPTTVYFATDRILTGPADTVASYGPNIQPPSVSTGIIYGTAFVDGIVLATNAHGVVSSIENTRTGGFSQASIDDMIGSKRNLLLFLHGFDNNFSDAITRAAFNREWMEASGVAAANTTVVAFSWPSLGKLDFPVLPDYQQDQGMARLSGVHLMTFLANMEPILRTARARGRRCFLLAHSMGNLALQSAVESWFLHGNGNAVLFDVAILAAGDCTDRTFGFPNLTGLSGLTLLTQRVAIYYSRADLVLLLSQTVNGGDQRLGQEGPRDKSDPIAFPPTRFHMVDASGFRDYDFNPLSSHQYYRMSPTARTRIVADMA